MPDCENKFVTFEERARGIVSLCGVIYVCIVSYFSIEFDYILEFKDFIIVFLSVIVSRYNYFSLDFMKKIHLHKGFSLRGLYWKNLVWGTFVFLIFSFLLYPDEWASLMFFFASCGSAKTIFVLRSNGLIRFRDVFQS